MINLLHQLGRSNIGQPEDNALQASRQKYLDTILMVSAVISSISSLFLIISAINSSSGWLPAVIQIIVTVTLILFTYQVDWSFNLRGSFLLFILFLVGVQDLLTVGFIGSAYLYLLALPIIATMIFGGRAGTFLASISIILFILAGANFNQLPISAEKVEFYTNGMGWLTKSFLFALIGTLIYLGLTQLFKATDRALEAEKQLEEDLIKEATLLEKRVENQNRALKIGVEVSRHITQFLQQDTLIEEVVKQVQKISNYAHVHLYLLDDAKQVLVWCGGTSNIASDQQITIALGQGVLGRAAATHRSQYVPDLNQLPESDKNPGYLDGITSEIAIPIGSADQVFGILNVQEHAANALDEDDLFLLETIASQVSVAFQNATLYDQVQKQVMRTRMINEIQHKIQSQQKIEEVLKVAAAELAKAFNAPKTHISMSFEDIRNVSSE